MSIPDAYRANFQTLLRAAADNALCLVECRDALTLAPLYVICAAAYDGETYTITPFGHLADGDPFQAYLPPA